MTDPSPPRNPIRAKGEPSLTTCPKNGDHLSRMRDEMLNKRLFTSLAHAREAVAAWADEYNAERPHSSLGDATPAAYAAGLRLAATQPVTTAADEGDNTRRSLVATG